MPWQSGNMVINHALDDAVYSKQLLHGTLQWCKQITKSANLKYAEKRTH